MAVKGEVARVSTAVALATIKVLPKPGASAGPSPPGNS
jgi:hypothetical protein